mmetsp:Transcript_49751/g.116292  ORF Transcript_49751/g.116292 Transcript_49751/m.116292 type:complete len:345 (+) Transcript_49751:72-1106(+)
MEAVSTVLIAFRQLLSCRRRQRPNAGNTFAELQTWMGHLTPETHGRPWMDAIDVESQEGWMLVQPALLGPPPAGRVSSGSSQNGQTFGNLDPTSFQAWHHAQTADEAVTCVESFKQAVLKLSASSLSFTTPAFSRLADGLVLNTQMVELRLHHCGLDCGSAAALATALRSNSTLRALSLECNRIGTLGARSFAETLLVNDELESLTLRQNVICKEGVVQLVRSLEQNHSLRFLDLQCNPAGNAMKAEIQTLLKRNKAPSRVITLMADREPGSSTISISCLNFAGEEVLHLDEPAEGRCRLMRTRIARHLGVPRHRLGLAVPSGQLLGRWMDTMTVAACLGLTDG